MASVMVRVSLASVLMRCISCLLCSISALYTMSLALSAASVVFGMLAALVDRLCVTALLP